MAGSNGRGSTTHANIDYLIKKIENNVPDKVKIGARPLNSRGNPRIFTLLLKL